MSYSGRTVLPPSNRRSSLGGVTTSEAPKNTKIFVPVEPDKLEIETHPLNLYSSPPFQGNIDLYEFQTIIVQRLALLQFLESSVGSSVQHVSSTVWITASLLDKVRHKLKEFKLVVNEASDVSLVNRRDDLGFFLLTLAYATDRDRQEWMLTQELRLLQVRMRLAIEQGSAGRTLQQSQQEIRKRILYDNFLHGKEQITYNVVAARGSGVLGADEVPDDMIKNVESAYVATLARDQQLSYSLYCAFKVPFYPDAVSLMRRRRCYVLGGFAYVPVEEMESIVLSRQKQNIRRCFELLTPREDHLQALFSDERFGKFLRSVKHINLGGEAQQVVQRRDEEALPKLSLVNIFQIEKSSFPPCMWRQFEFLKSKQHLRHWSRLQLFLFVKDAGMPMQEALQLFSRMWGDSKSFDKEHRYNIRYCYGQEGRRADKPCYSCVRLQSGVLPVPGQGEVHGCPFRTMGKDSLRVFLRDYGVADTSIGEILSRLDTGEYSMACRSTFVAKHPNSDGGAMGQTPVQYLKESLRHHILYNSRALPSTNAMTTTTDENHAPPTSGAIGNPQG